MVVDSTHQSGYSDEKKENSHCNDTSDDPDAGHQAQASPPGSHSNKQEAYQLEQNRIRFLKDSSRQHSQINKRVFHCWAKMRE